MKHIKKFTIFIFCFYFLNANDESFAPITLDHQSVVSIDNENDISLNDENKEDEFVVVDSVGAEEYEDDELADRDRDIPMLYDQNRIDLMHKRDRKLRKKGICQPPPDVITSPYLYTPSPGQQVTR